MKARLGIDTHARYRELLAARLDRPLTRPENRLLIGHLKGCPDCQQAERDYLAQGSLLRSMPKPIPPRDMWARTSTALDRAVSRWSYRYPRFGRRAIARDRSRRAGAPGALATVVAALGVVTAVAVLQLAPALRPAPVTAPMTAPVTDSAPLGTVAVALRPTPFAVAPQPLSLVAAGETDLSIYQTSVDQVCPQSTPDCFFDEKIVGRNVKLPRHLRPQNVALSPNGEQLAFVGHEADQDVITVVMLQNAGSGAIPGRSPRTPEPTRTASLIPATATPTNAVEESPPVEPTESGSPGDSPPPPTETVPATPGVTDPDPTPTTEPSDDPPPSVEPTPPAAPESPPASVVPDLVVLSILQDVHSAGAPPAWSQDGQVLAFSAMPSDGSHGPDVYVWRPGDGQARAITTDHASYFASWSGGRIVASRVNQTLGKSDSADVLTVVIDPTSLEERRVHGPKMWLPVVDPDRAHAVGWHGRLDLTDDLPTVVEGALYIVDWAAMDPFGTADDTDSSSRDALVAIDAARDPAANPVIDWNVRWSADGLVLGVWEGDAPGASWGELRLLAFDRESGQISSDEPLFKLTLAKRGFTLGVDRVAWVSPSDDGTEGELRVRTWGVDGVGDLRIETLDLQELVPSF
jgi:hypothetical protein